MELYKNKEAFLDSIRETSKTFYLNWLKMLEKTEKIAIDVHLQKMDTISTKH